jgi:hypothetical protein
MDRMKARNIAVLVIALVGLVSCGTFGSFSSAETQNTATAGNVGGRDQIETDTSKTVWSLFNKKSSESVVLVNKYLWSASLEVLGFLPVQTVDPFTGVIVTGYGTPPGGGKAYRATVLIDDPALDARSLNLALQSRNGPVSAATSRAVEDAILSRARELRIADNKL